jgi:hypothetical protein
MMVSEDQLVSELWARDVRFLRGKALTNTPTLSPQTLLISLAESQDARVRLSLIPLLLRHPEFAGEAEIVDKKISNPESQLIFRFFFTAAMLFQRMYKKQLQKYLGDQAEIPDLFSSKLGLALMKDPDLSLRELAERHKILSGHRINWIGTYRHAPDVWLRQLELHKAHQ